MSIFVTKYPSRITGADNPVVFELSSAPTIPGDYSSFNILYSVDEPVGCSYELSWPDGEKKTMIYCVLNPDNSGTQFPSRQGEPWEEWLDMVAFYLNMNVELTADFEIQAMNQDMMINFMSKKMGTEFNMGILLIGSNATIFKQHSGIDPVIKQNQLLGLEVWRQINGIDTQISEDLTSGRIVSGSMVVQFDISEILKAHCLSEVNPIIPPSLTLILRNSINPPYYVKYFERYNGSDSEELTSRWFFSLNGGVPQWKQLLFYKTYDNLQQYFTTAGRYFLTWCNFVKNTDFNAPEKLFLLFPTTPSTTNFVLRVTLHFYETVDEIRELPIHKTFYSGEVYELDVSARVLLSTRPQGLKGYDIQFIATNSTYFSEIIRFSIDPVFRPYLRYFVFLNSLGAYECVRLFGVGDLQLSFKREIIAQSTLEEYSPAMSPITQQPPEKTRTVTVNTGYESLEYCEWFEDFLSSTNVFEVMGSAWVPVVIIEDKAQLSKDNQFLKKISVTYIYPDHSFVFQREKAVSWSTVSVIGTPYI